MITKAPPVPIVQGLVDVCSEVLAFAVQLRRAADPGDSEVFRAKVDDLFRAMEARAREAQVPNDPVQSAKYALAALIDETVLNSRWSIRDAWMSQPLQLQYFNDFAAGEEFFRRLEELRSSTDPQKIDVLEVYYLCLSLGFKGKYSDFAGMEKLKSLTQTVAQDLHRARTGGTEGLSPKWQPPDSGAARVVSAFPVWIVVVGCAGFIVLLYAILSTVLGMVHRGVINKIG